MDTAREERRCKTAKQLSTLVHGERPHQPKVAGTKVATS